ncbi:MAG: ABC transporter ATP-binding protein [Actinomycetia bacterium]|nr:ABC transporter ATP-binding protein [Actinomycetes bacterium]
MIEAKQLTKRFNDVVALDGLTTQIPEGTVYGLVGSNGAGKSTLLRLMAGVYRADGGTLTIRQEPIYENPALKAEMAFVSDELYFLSQASLNRMSELYACAFDDFSRKRFNELVTLFELDPKKRIATFSKGMRRQAALLLALARRPRYLLIDEIFDGLDPVMRNIVRKLIYGDVCDRQATAIISSHSLRELEDTCDQLALLHQGRIIFESEMDDLQTGLSKMQLVFAEEQPDGAVQRQLHAAGLDPVKISQLGKVTTVILDGAAEDLRARVNAATDPKPAFTEEISLTLEEVFTYKMEAFGYHTEEVLPDEEPNPSAVA